MSNKDQTLKVILGPERFSTSQYQFRYLLQSDYSKGVFEVLSQLTKAPQPSLQNFKSFWALQHETNSKHINIVGIDKKTDKVIAFGTILIVNSVLNGRMGKIQNIVTCKSVRGKGLGKVVIDILKQEGWREQCQVIGLFCQQHNVKFYEKLGFRKEGMISACYK